MSGIKIGAGSSWMGGSSGGLVGGSYAPTKPGYVIKNPFVTKQRRGCEWPLGHPDEMDFHFCNKERFFDKPYCLLHCSVAYVLPEKEEELKSINKVA